MIFLPGLYQPTSTFSLPQRFPCASRPRRRFRCRYTLWSFKINASWFVTLYGVSPPTLHSHPNGRVGCSGYLALYSIIDGGFIRRQCPFKMSMRFVWVALLRYPGDANDRSLSVSLSLSLCQFICFPDLVQLLSLPLPSPHVL